jgi:invasion protein IalB
MQEVRTAETDQRVLRMALVREDDGGAAVALVAPFGVRVADGVGIAAGSAGGTGQARADFVTCLQAGCIATGALDAAMLDALLAAEIATITMATTGSETVTLELSLAGFGAAWRRLGTLN